MKLELRKAGQFIADFEEQVHWYEQKGGAELSERFFSAVKQTLEVLSEHPGLGRKRRFPQRELRGVHSFAIARPFNRYLVFYRFDETSLEALRLMHGARDLPRRLLEPSGENDAE